MKTQKNSSLEQQLHALEEATRSCVQCSLAAGRTNVVPGEGSAQAEIMFIGEGPGKNEDEQGRPFVGTAGKLLSELIGSIGLSREEVYIANVVKCRPPGNRDPLPQEAEACWPWLEKQVFLIKPKLIIPLGRHSLARFLPAARISFDHGRALRKLIRPTSPDLANEPPVKFVFFPCYHPAAALYNGSLREVLFKDFKKIPKLLEIIRSDISSAPSEEKRDPNENLKEFFEKKKTDEKQGRLF